MFRETDLSLKTTLNKAYVNPCMVGLLLRVSFDEVHGIRFKFSKTKTKIERRSWCLQTLHGSELNSNYLFQIEEKQILVKVWPDFAERFAVVVPHMRLYLKRMWK